MRQLSESDRQPRLGRVFPDSNYTPKELARLEAERDALFQRCYQIFQQVQPKLLKDYYDWFMVIEPKSGDYFIDEEESVAQQKAHQKYPDRQCVIFCINETGACSRV